MNCRAEEHKGSRVLWGPLGLEAGGGDWKGEAVYEQERGSQQCFWAGYFEKQVPLYELPSLGHAGKAGNACELGKTWLEAMLHNRANAFL